MTARTAPGFLLAMLLLQGCGDDGGVDPDAAVLDGGMDTGRPGDDAGPTPDTGGGGDSGGVPETFQVLFMTTAGDFTVEVTRSWSPAGVDRFHELVTSGYYDGCTFFRVVPGFVVQFGINGDPTISAMWRSSTIADDPVVESNLRGTVTFAKTGAPDSRTTQLFINYGDNSALDSMGFSPFGHVITGMESVDAINPEFGEMPDQSRIHGEGDAYLDASFPTLDRIVSATVL